MFNPVRSRFSLAVGALLAMAAMPAAAGPSLEDTLALSMSKGLRDRMFWNLSVVSTKTKTKSEQPQRCPWAAWCPSRNWWKCVMLWKPIRPN